MALSAAAIGVQFGWQAAHSATGRLDGDGPGSLYIFAGIAAFAAMLMGIVERSSRDLLAARSGGG